MTDLEPMSIVSLQRFTELTSQVASQIRADADFEPDALLALSTGGFPVAAVLAKRLNIHSRNVIGVPIHRDDEGNYRLDDTLLQLQTCEGRTFLIVDDASNRGVLTQQAVDAIRALGGSARSCVLIANENGVLPDYFGVTCPGKPPKFFWEDPGTN